MRKITYIMAFCVLFGTQDLYAQMATEQKEVLSVIEELFNGYREGDSSRVSKTFLKGAMMQRVQEKDGKITVTESRSVQNWLNYIGSGLEKMHDEPIWDSVVQIDGGLANVWTKYAFYLDGEFSHCGVDSFTLVKTDLGWKIFHIVDTSRKEDCDIPTEIAQKHGKKG